MKYTIAIQTAKTNFKKFTYEVRLDGIMVKAMGKKWFIDTDGAMKFVF